MKKWFYFLFALVLYVIIHEHLHVLISIIFNEFDKIKFHWYGPEVLYLTPVEERIPELKWFFISGFSNLFTIAIGYLLFLMRSKILNLKNTPVKNILYYVTVVFLLFDAINLSIGPFFYGGDALGIAAGLKSYPWIIQMFFGIILLINRELIISFMRSFGIRSNNILFKSFRYQ